MLGSSSLPRFDILYSFSISTALFFIWVFMLETVSWKTGISKMAAIASLACWVTA